MFIRIVQISSLATACTTSAHILEPYWTKLDVCPDSCSVKKAVQQTDKGAKHRGNR